MRLAAQMQQPAKCHGSIYVIICSSCRPTSTPGLLMIRMSCFSNSLSNCTLFLQRCTGCMRVSMSPQALHLDSVTLIVQPVLTRHNFPCSCKTHVDGAPLAATIVLTLRFASDLAVPVSVQAEAPEVLLTPSRHSSRIARVLSAWLMSIDQQLPVGDPTLTRPCASPHFVLQAERITCALLPTQVGSGFKASPCSVQGHTRGFKEGLLPRVPAKRSLVLQKVRWLVEAEC